MSHKTIILCIVVVCVSFHVTKCGQRGGSKTTPRTPYYGFTKPVRTPYYGFTKPGGTTKGYRVSKGTTKKIRTTTPVPPTKTTKRRPVEQPHTRLNRTTTRPTTSRPSIVTTKSHPVEQPPTRLNRTTTRPTTSRPSIVTTKSHPVEQPPTRINRTTTKPTTSRPPIVTTKSHPVEQPPTRINRTTTRPTTSRPPIITTVRPTGFTTPRVEKTTNSSKSWNNTRPTTPYPHPDVKTVRPLGSPFPNQEITTKNYSKSGNGTWPPYPPPGNFGHPPGFYPPDKGDRNVQINTVNNYFYSHPPVYTTKQTGDSTLGFFLGYALGKVSTPSYHVHNVYNDQRGYIPRYDHYTVHHYYHNRDTVPKESVILPRAVVLCAGDSGTFCPANTTSLCTNNGTVLCVASVNSTVPCSSTKQKGMYCVRSSVPCENNNSTLCTSSKKTRVVILIPCISTTKLYGNISYVNNSVIVSNTTTVSNVSSITTNNFGQNVTSYSSVTVTDTTVVGDGRVLKKVPPQSFCVTVLALPAERELTQEETFFNHAKTVFSAFAVKALGLD